jgi:hypothetical protein
VVRDVKLPPKIFPLVVMVGPLIVPVKAGLAVGRYPLVMPQVAVTICPLALVPTQAEDSGTAAPFIWCTVGLGYVPERSPPAVPVGAPPVTVQVVPEQVIPPPKVKAPVLPLMELTPATPVPVPQIALVAEILPLASACRQRNPVPARFVPKIEPLVVSPLIVSVEPVMVPLKAGAVNGR